MTTWFTADTHFGHRAILEYTDRIDATVEEMDERLVAVWNSIVLPGDTVWHLGDFSFHKRAEAQTLFDRLNGAKHLVAGNHDNRQARNLGWESVSDLHTVKVDTDDGRFEAVLCHYPLMTWNRAQHGRVHLHGHSHGNIAQASTRFDVGWDGLGTWMTGFGQRLASAEQIMFHIHDRGSEYVPVDHHA